MLASGLRQSYRSGVLALFYLFVPYVVQADFSGPVVSILDGDTIELRHNTRPERIRLNGIDCLNYGQFAPRNQVEFNSATDAEESRYQVTGNCP